MLMMNVNVQRLGFDKFKEDVEDVLKDHKQLQKVRHYVLHSRRLDVAPLSDTARTQDREKKVSKFEQSGLTEEELLAQQEALFAQSRARFQSTQQ